MSKISGSCLCEKVSFVSNNDFNQFQLCHCSQCQKITGSAYAANLFTAPHNIKWLSGSALVKRFDAPGRSISKAFCTECGCGVPYLSSSGKALVIPAGCLNGNPSIEPQGNIFYSEKVGWYEKSISSRVFEKFPE